MKFCTECGRNDLVHPLLARHFASGKLCAGPLIIVQYKRIDKAREREVKGGESS